MEHDIGNLIDIFAILKNKFRHIKQNESTEIRTTVQNCLALHNIFRFPELAKKTFQVNNKMEYVTLDNLDNWLNRATVWLKKNKYPILKAVCNIYYNFF